MSEGGPGGAARRNRRARPFTSMTCAVSAKTHHAIRASRRQQGGTGGDCRRIEMLHGLA
jgi:hypothetical protein